MDVHAAIGKRIRELRLHVGLTQAKLADQAGTSVEYVSRIENNRRAASVLLLQRIADALGVAVRELFDFESDTAVCNRTARGNRIALLVERLDDDDAALLEEFVVKFGKKLQK